MQQVKLLKKLNVSNEKPRVSNIKNHQNLYKEFHKTQKKFQQVVSLMKVQMI